MACIYVPSALVASLGRRVIKLAFCLLARATCAQPSWSIPSINKVCVMLASA
jgi:uncharacterized protein (DUF2336 family)